MLWTLSESSLSFLYSVGAKGLQLSRVTDTCLFYIFIVYFKKRIKEVVYMQLKRVSDKNEYETIERIYNEAFPDDERAPMKLLKKRADKGKADFWALYAGERPVGMAYVVCCRDLAYLFYIAVDRSQRGKGYGTRTIHSLLEKYKGKRFFLALEQLDETAQNYEQRVKRHEFYKSCGLRDLPFRLKEGSVTFAAMGGRRSDVGVGENADFTVAPEEYKELMNSYIGFIMRFFVDLRLLPPSDK